MLLKHGYLQSSSRSAVLMVPGNHDQRDFMQHTFPELFEAAWPACCFSARVCGWRLLGLETQDTDAKIGWDGEMESLRRRGYDGGSAVVKPSQLDWLNQQFTAAGAEEVPTLLFMHHPPVQVNNWMEDTDRFQDPRWVATPC